MAKDCPRCRLVNPSDAQRCDCGYDFLTRRMERTYLMSGQVPKAAGIGIGSHLLIWMLFHLISRLFAN
jgi:hypothetical protein